MPQGPRDNRKLSKHLLQMKFMKISRERIQKEKDEEDGRAMFYNHISDELKSSSSKFISESSWVICEDLQCGRRSFKGMNPIIEKHFQFANDDKNFAKNIKEENVDITAEEMAQQQYSSHRIKRKKFNYSE